MDMHNANSREYIETIFVSQGLMHQSFKYIYIHSDEKVGSMILIKVRAMKT